MTTSTQQHEDPQTREEWQDVVDACEFLLQLDSARQYGLIKGGPECNVERCEELLDRAKHQGIYPREDFLERAFAGMGLVVVSDSKPPARRKPR